jgi:uncharacterized protein (TIGR02217 family)
MANAIVTLDGSALTFLDGLGGLILPMATIPTFPTLKGLAWPVGRAPLQSTLKQKAISGKETRLQLYSFGLYKYELTFSYLGSGAQNQDWQLLMSFFQLVAGAALPFHFNDVYDNAIAGQMLGTGDGATRSFNFARTLSLITEPVQDVTQASVTVRVATVAQDSSSYSFLTDPNWGFAYGIEFDASHVPASGAPVTADFSYNWPCRFDDDTAEFSSFMFNFWELKKLSFTTLKAV